jgi:hypothetical protein
MHQPYPLSGKPVEPERPPAPPSVQKAVKLMYAGAALSTVSLITSLVGIGNVKPAIRKQFPHYTVTQVNQAFVAFLVVVIASAAIGIGLWLWMAWANNQGKNWARIVSTVLFAVSTLELLQGLRGPRTVIGTIFSALVWLVGLGAVILIWRRESSEFFKPRQLV